MMLSRRGFLQSTAIGLGSIAVPTWLFNHSSASKSYTANFPEVERLGRVISGMVEVKAKASEDSQTVQVLYEDDIVEWYRETVGSRPLWYNQNYVETPSGYIYAPNLQLVENKPNQPLTELPIAGGTWVEVSVPYVDLVLANPPARSLWLEYTSRPRLYYSQIMWVDQIRQDDDGQVWYQTSDRYGSFGDVFWVPAEALRPLSQDELAPIHPDVEDKLVVVDLTYQTLSCFEGDTEVYFCKISSGPKIVSAETPNGEWATPLGKHTIWRKMISVHMTGGTTGGGYDIPGIGWTVLFSGKGMAIHSTFWHNSFGIPQSHGCVNARPEDAKWIFRWTLPVTPFDSGDVTVSGDVSTKVLVEET